MPKTDPQTVTESNVAPQQETVENGVCEPDHQIATETNHVAKNELEISQGSHEDIQNGTQITHDAVQGDGDEVQNTYTAVVAEEAIKLEPPSAFETPPESPQDSQTAAEDNTQVTQADKLTHSAPGYTQDALVSSSTEEVPTKHLVSSVQKM